MKLRYEDYPSTAAYFVAVHLDSQKQDYGIEAPLPTPQEIDAAIDRSGAHLYDAIGVAHEMAAEFAYDAFPAFREEQA